MTTDGQGRWHVEAGASPPGTLPLGPSSCEWPGGQDRRGD